MKRIIQNLPAAVIFCVLITACENQPLDLGDEGFNFDRGVYIVNEGIFQSANSSISFYDPLTDSVYNNVFYRANQSPVGDVANSITLWQDDAYIVINNSGKIYRAGRTDMVYKGKVTGLTSPRYLAVVRSMQGGEKAYVSDLYSGMIMVVDPLEVTVLDSIKISRAGGRFSSEQMIVHDGKLYVACWSYGEQVLVIDTGTDMIVDSIQLGKQPNSMVLDKDGYLWVLSDGGYPFSPFGHEKASLSRVNLETNHAESMMVWDDIGASPIDLCVNSTGDSLYFISEGVYKVSLDMEGSGEPLIREDGRAFYSLGVDPIDGHIYVGDAVDYQQDGWVFRYSSSGVLVDSFQAGVNPGHFCFSAGRQR